MPVLIGAVLLVLEAQIKSCLAEDGKEGEVISVILIE